MPEDEPINTPTPFVVVPRFPRLVTANEEPNVSVRHSPAECELLLACQLVLVRSETMRLLIQAVADVSPDDPGHEASYAVVGQLRTDWVAQLARVYAIPAQEARGVAADSAPIASLVKGDEADRVEGSPALQIAPYSWATCSSSAKADRHRPRS